MSIKRFDRGRDRAMRVYPENTNSRDSLTRHDSKGRVQLRVTNHMNSGSIGMVKKSLEFVIRHTLASSAACGGKRAPIGIVG
jgi:hypothetical protein